MKIFHVLNHFLPHQTAGTEIYVWALCKNLNLKGHNSSVVIPNYNVAISEKYEYDNIKVFKFAEPSIVDRELITGQRVADGLEYFKKYINEEKPDIIHFHEIAGSNGIGVAHFKEARKTDAKIFFTIHLTRNTCKTGTLMVAEKYFCDGLIEIQRCSYCALVTKTKSELNAKMFTVLGQILYRFGYNTIEWQNKIGTALSFPFQIEKLRNDLDRIVESCDKIIPITNWYQKILLLNGVPENKLTLVRQGLPTTPPVETLGFHKSYLPLKIIFLGRIDSLKGIPLLLEVIKKFSPLEIQLDIYGSPSSQIFMDECLVQTKEAGHIRWMGKISQEKVISIMSKYDILILPSAVCEMAPLVIEEAKFAHLPVIGSDIYGIAEQIQDKVNGWLFKFKNAESLSLVLRQLINQPSLIDEARKNISKTKNFTEIADAYIKIYRS